MKMTASVKTKICNFSIIMVAVLCLGACSNTLEGIGRDIENTGEKIQETF